MPALPDNKRLSIATACIAAVVLCLVGWGWTNSSNMATSLTQERHARQHNRSVISDPLAQTTPNRAQSIEQIQINKNSTSDYCNQEADKDCLNFRAVAAAEDAAFLSLLQVIIGGLGTLGVVAALTMNVLALRQSHRDFIASHPPILRLRYVKVGINPDTKRHYIANIALLNEGSSDAAIVRVGIRVTGDRNIFEADDFEPPKSEKCTLLPGEQLNIHSHATDYLSEDAREIIEVMPLPEFVRGSVIYHDNNGTHRVVYIRHIRDGTTGKYRQIEEEY